MLLASIMLNIHVNVPPINCVLELNMNVKENDWWWLLARIHLSPAPINTLRLRQNGRHFADDIFKCIFLSENVRIAIKISLKFVPKDPINNIPSLVQIMAWP